MLFVWQNLSLHRLENRVLCGTARSDELKKLGVTSKQVVDTIVKGLGGLPRVTGGVKNAFESMGDSIKVSAATFGEAINKTLNFEGFLNGLSEKLEGLAAGFANLAPGTQKFIILGGALAAAIGPVLFGVGALAAAIPTLAAGFAVLTGPVGLVAAGFVALSVAAIKTFSSVKKTSKSCKSASKALRV